MDLTDVNILVYAHRAELPSHSLCKAWLDDKINGIETDCTWITADKGFSRFPGLRWKLLVDSP